MSQTEHLLSLIDEFPRAFTDPETQAHPEVTPRTPEETTAKTQQLLELIREFPPSFCRPGTDPHPTH